MVTHLAGKPQTPTAQGSRQITQCNKAQDLYANLSDRCPLLAQSGLAEQTSFRILYQRSPQRSERHAFPKLVAMSLMT